MMILGKFDMRIDDMSGIFTIPSSSYYLLHSYSRKANIDTSIRNHFFWEHVTDSSLRAWSSSTSGLESYEMIYGIVFSQFYCNNIGGNGFQSINSEYITI